MKQTKAHNTCALPCVVEQQSVEALAEKAHIIGTLAVVDAQNGPRLQWRVGVSQLKLTAW